MFWQTTLKPVSKRGLMAKPQLEDVLAEELKREMFITAGLKFRYVDDWDTVMHSVYELPIEYDGYTKRVGDMQMVKEMIDILARGDFDDVKRSESRRKQMKEFKKTMHMYYNLIFTKKDSKVGYGALIHFPDLRENDPERSSGIVLLARHRIEGKSKELDFEKAKFDDFLLEVRPYIEMLGDLYRRTRKP